MPRPPSVEAELADLRARLSELQQSVELLGSQSFWSLETGRGQSPGADPESPRYNSAHPGGAYQPAPPVGYTDEYRQAPSEPWSGEILEPHGVKPLPAAPPPPANWEQPFEAPLTYPTPPATAYGHTTDPARPFARSSAVGAVDAGPFEGLIALRHFENELRTLHAVRDVRIRRFGQSRADIEVGMNGPYALARELYRLRRSMEITEGPEGQIVIDLGHLPDPTLPCLEDIHPSHSPSERSTMTGIQTVSLEPNPAHPTWDPVNSIAAQMLPEQVCRHFHMLPISHGGQALVVAMADPGDRMAQNVAFALTSDPLEVVLAGAHQIEDAIDRVFGGSSRAVGFDQAVHDDFPETGDAERPMVVAPGRIAEILVDRGLIDDGVMARALVLQEETGSRIGEILDYGGEVRERDFAVALADQLRVPLVDLYGIEPAPAAMAMIPEELQRECRCLPLEVDEQALYVAITDPLDDETYEAIRELTDLRIRTYMVTRSDLDGLMRRIHGEAHVPAARVKLLTRLPKDFTIRVLSSGLRIFLLALLIAVLVGFVLASC